MTDDSITKAYTVYPVQKKNGSGDRADVVNAYPASNEDIGLVNLRYHRDRQPEMCFRLISRKVVERLSNG